MPAPPVFISDAAARQVLNWPEMIEAVRRTYSTRLSPQNSPPRTLARADGVWMRTLTGVDPSSGFMGVKQFGLSRRKRLNYLISLFDQDDGSIVALLDGHAITALRTAATSAVAVHRLAAPGPALLGVLGSGTEAYAHVRAIHSIRPLERLTVYSTSPKRREAFARKFSDEFGLPCHAVATPNEAVDGQSIIVAATRTRDGRPVLEGAWLTPGMLTVSIGATLPEQCEIDVAAISRADLIVADNPQEVMFETGCFRAAAREGLAFSGKFVSLNQLMLGEADARVRESQVPLYRSVGGPLQDIAVAALALRLASNAGLAIPLPMSFAEKAD